MTRPTANQVRVLRAIEICQPADGWGEVFTHYDAQGWTDDNPARFLVMRNFDASVKASKFHGWILDDDDGIRLTPAGEHALASPVRRCAWCGRPVGENECSRCWRRAG